MAPSPEPDDARLDAAVRAVARERSERLVDHPSASQLADYSLGLHRPEEEESIQEHLALCPECAQAVLDLMAFGEAPEADAALPDLETAREWPRLAARLRAASARSVRPPAWGSAAAWGLAASLLLSAGLLVWSLRLRNEVSRAEQPSGDVLLADLTPLGRSAERAGRAAPRITVSSGAERLVLVLNLGDLRTFPAYRMELLGPHGERVWTDDDVLRSEFGSFLLVLPTGDLAAGRHEVRVFGVGEEGRELLARYVFELARLRR